MATFAFMHYPYLVHILFGMPSLHLFTFLMFFKSCTYIIMLPMESLRRLEVDILGVNILGVNILGVDILGS